MIEQTLGELTTLTEMPHWVKVLIYGPPGAGKTVFAAKAPYPIHMDCDGTGTLSLLNHPELISRTRVLRSVNLQKAIDIFQAKIAGRPEIAWAQTIVVDTIDALAGVNLKDIIQRDKKVHESRDEIGFQRDYKFNTAEMDRLLDLIVAVQCNVVVLAHDEEVRDDATGVVTHGPYLSKRLRSFVEQKFDVFGYMTARADMAGNVARQVQLVDTGRIKAKTRIGGLPPTLADPSMEHFIYAKQIMLQNAAAYVQAEYEQYQQQQAGVTPETPVVEERLVEPPDGTPAFTLGAEFTPQEAVTNA